LNTRNTFVQLCPSSVKIIKRLISLVLKDDSFATTMSENRKSIKKTDSLVATVKFVKGVVVQQTHAR
jgi:hypothetical protein